MLRKTLFIILLTIFVLLICINIYFYLFKKRELVVTFCDVGQGDAVYVQLPNGQDMLIDGGPNRKVLECLGKYMSFFDRTIDYIFLTHSDADHLTGLIDVVNRYKIGLFFYSKYHSDTDKYRSLVNSLRKNYVEQRVISKGYQISIDETKLSVLWPEVMDQEEVVKNTNDYSLYLHLRYQNFDTLFTGDGGTFAQQRLDVEDVSHLKESHVEILKVPHHGSSNGLDREFVGKISPQVAIISVGRKNPYGHPAQSAIDILNEIHAVVYRTDQVGDVQVFSSGQTFRVH